MGAIDPASNRRIRRSSCSAWTFGRLLTDSRSHFVADRRIHDRDSNPIRPNGSPQATGRANARRNAPVRSTGEQPVLHARTHCAQADRVVGMDAERGECVVDRRPAGHSAAHRSVQIVPHLELSVQQPVQHPVVSVLRLSSELFVLRVKNAEGCRQQAFIRLDYPDHVQTERRWKKCNRFLQSNIKEAALREDEEGRVKIKRGSCVYKSTAGRSSNSQVASRVDRSEHSSLLPSGNHRLGVGGRRLLFALGLGGLDGRRVGGHLVG